MLAFLAFKENSHPTIEIWLYYGFVPRCYASLVFSEAWPNLDRQSIFLDEIMYFESTYTWS